MKSAKQINKNPAEQTLSNYLTACNALSKQQIENGYEARFLTRKTAQEQLLKHIRMSVALANPNSSQHSVAYNALSKQLGGIHSDALNYVENMGRSYLTAAMSIANSAEKAGMQHDQAIALAFNSLAGNPVFDHFGNLNALAGQLYENMTFVESFQANGDSYALPTESGRTGTDVSRFRGPSEQVTGSAKQWQGDINPIGYIRNDANRLQVNLFNEFKNAMTLYIPFSIDQDMRNQALGYQDAVEPALGGFILQNRYFPNSIQAVMKLAELLFVGGQDTLGNFTPGVGGSYGILSDSILLQLGDWDAAQPQPARPADWNANPNKLIQKIQNFYAIPTDATAPLDASIDPSLYYKDIVRLFALHAIQNVDFMAKEFDLYVPTSWYAIAVQYPGTQSGANGQGTFNKNLNQMVSTATNNLIQNITIKPSSLLNWQSVPPFNSNVLNYNYFVAIPQGCPAEKKPVIMPGRTAAPYVVSESVSTVIMNFYTEYLFGGPMVMQYGGALVLEYSKAYP